MKKMISMIVAVMCISGITACTKDETKSDAIDTIVEVMEETAEEITEEVTEATTEEINNQLADFEIGDWEDDRYVNHFVDMSFPMIKGWKKMTDEELAGYGGLTEEEILALRDGEISPEDAIMYYCFAIKKKNGIGNIVYGFENLNNSTSTGLGKIINEEEYIKAVADNLGQSEETEYKIEKIAPITIADKEFYELTVTTMKGSLVQKYYVHKVDCMMCFIMVTVYKGYEDDVEGFINGITTIEGANISEEETE